MCLEETIDEHCSFKVKQEYFSPRTGQLVCCCLCFGTDTQHIINVSSGFFSMNICSPTTVPLYVTRQSASLMSCHYLLLSLLLDCMPDTADNTVSLTLIHSYWPYLSICVPWKYSALLFLSNSDCFFKRKSMFLAALQEQHTHTQSERERSE